MTLATGDAAMLANVEVLKAHGTGNDFVVLVDPDDLALDLSATTVRDLCHRHLGIGADGLLRVGGSPTEGSLGDVDVVGAQVMMDYRNGDGSVAEMCGNGIRVTARIALEHGLVPPTDSLAVATRSGVRHVEVHVGEDQRFAAASVDMGPPALDADAVGIDVTRMDGTIMDFTLPDMAHRFTGVSMGNPHVVMQVDDVPAFDLATAGPRIERHAAFRDGVNVNVVQVVDDARLRLRTWERGVGATMSCGSGACATVAALRAGGMVDPKAEVVVEVPGGNLLVRFDEQGHLVMTGSATIVARIDLGSEWFDPPG